MDISDQLREHLEAADYTVDAVMARIGGPGQDGLQRNSTIPARAALGDDRDPQATLIRLFPLAQTVPVADAEAALPLAALTEEGLVEVTGDQVRATADVRPYGFEQPGGGQWDGWFVSDPTPGLDNDRRPPAPDYVLGVSSASTTLAQLTIDDQVGSALDLGTGCGVQSLHLSTHARRIVATDVNQRALRLARLTAGLNRLEVDLREGSLYEPVAGERFDLIVSNPPYVMSPPDTSPGRLLYREGTAPGDELIRTVVQESGAHLNPDGTAQVLANWAITDEPWTERLAGWAPAGCDLWVLERERLDIYQYIEMWLADAGLSGDQQWPQRYREWLDYFARLGVHGVGMGWITIVNAGRDRPDITVESWPHDVLQPVGPAIANHRHAVGWATKPDAELLATNWELADHVVQETLGRPGEADPSYVVLRQANGLKRAMSVDTALGGVLGACDGSMPLDTIIDAVADLLDTEADRLRANILPRVREAITDGYLRPVRGV